MAWTRSRAGILLALGATASFVSFACGTATFEGSSADAGAGSEAGADGATAGNDAALGPEAGRFCTTQSPPPEFCADFDDNEIRDAFLGSTDTTFFLPPNPTDGGILALVPSGENGSQALQAFLPALPTTGPFAEYMSGGLPNLHASHVTLRTDLRFDALDDVSGSTHVYLLTFELDGPVDKTQYALVGYGGKLHVDIGKNSVFQNSIELGPPPAQAAGWVTYTLDVDIAGVGTANAKLGSQSGVSAAFANETEQGAAIAFGLQSAGDSASFEVSFDNATLRVVKVDAGVGPLDGG